MTVYIPKERLGSDSRPPSGRLRGKVIPVRTDGSYTEGRIEELRSGWDTNAEVQRHRTLTPEEKAREAIDRQTALFKEHHDKMAGSDTTGEKARKEAVRIANLAERKKSG